MNYLVLDQIKNGDCFCDEFETKEEAVECAKATWEHLTEAEKNRRESVAVVASVNPDEEAENHFDGDIVYVRSLTFEKSQARGEGKQMIRYQTEFKVARTVQAMQEARAYLRQDNMTDFLDDHRYGAWCSDVVHVEWELTAPTYGRVTVITKRPLSEPEKKSLSRWIAGQCSDGLGEGFEQQDWRDWESDIEEDEATQDRMYSLISPNGAFSLEDMGTITEETVRAQYPLVDETRMKSGKKQEEYDRS